MTLALAKISPTQARHVHDSLVLGVVTAGTRRIDTSGTQTLIPQGAVFALAPGQAHACAPHRAERCMSQGEEGCMPQDGEGCTPQEKEGCAYLAFSIGPQALPPALAELHQGAPRLLTPRIDDSELAELLVRLAEALDRPSGLLERQSLLAECLERLAGHLLADGGAAGETVAASGVAKAVQAARQRLEETLEEGLDLARLAAGCGLGMYALHRAFTLAVGLPPHAFQTHLRLRRAKELLRGGASLAEAALSSGFCDQAHMTRHFARAVGLTPAEYARAHKNRV